jgi:type IV pilus assembly protein PilW
MPIRQSSSKCSPEVRVMHFDRSHGFSLVELMVSMAMGLFLVGGALTIYVQGRATHEVNSKVAELQDNARLALDLISQDVLLSDYWARTDDPVAIARRTGDAANPMPAALEPANDCYAGYYLNVELAVDGANDDQVGAGNPFSACVADDARAPDTDMLVVRHASATQTPRASVVNNTVYLISNPVTGSLFVGGQPLPAGYAADDPVNELVTNAYYVGPSSTAGSQVPSLRRMTLGNGPTLLDEELVPGVEDLQVQLGIDTDADGSVNSYLSPGSPALAGTRIVAVRLWLRLRAEKGEVGFTDGATYEYAGHSVEPADSLRRMVVSTTIQLRNRSTT